MKIAWQVLKTHPISIIAYILYTTLCYETITTSLRFSAARDHIPHGDKIAWGEGVVYGELLTFIIGIAFTVVIILNAFFRKTGQSFYLWLCLFIVLPLFVLAEITG